MKDQLRRATVSVMINVAEGFDCDSDLEFARFLGIARRSAVEVQSLLYAALDVHYITQAEFDQHYEQARIAKALIGGFKRSLIKKRNCLPALTPDPSPRGRGEKTRKIILSQKSGEFFVPFPSSYGGGLGWG